MSILRPLGFAMALVLALPSGAIAGRVCPPASLNEPLPGVAEVTLHQTGVSTAQFPGQWQEGNFGGAKLAYRLFSDGSGTVSSDLNLRGWHVDFTCDLQTQSCTYHAVAAPPADAVETARAIGACLTASVPRPRARPAFPQAAASDVPVATRLTPSGALRDRQDAATGDEANTAPQAAGAGPLAATTPNAAAARPRPGTATQSRDGQTAQSSDPATRVTPSGKVADLGKAWPVPPAAAPVLAAPAPAALAPLADRTAAPRAAGAGPLAAITPKAAAARPRTDTATQSGDGQTAQSSDPATRMAPSGKVADLGKARPASPAAAPVLAAPAPAALAPLADQTAAPVVAAARPAPERSNVETALPQASPLSAASSPADQGPAGGTASLPPPLSAAPQRLPLGNPQAGLDLPAQCTARAAACVLELPPVCWADRLPNEPVTARIQRLLLLAGFDAGPVDGHFGTRTHAALLRALGKDRAAAPAVEILADLHRRLCEVPDRR